MKPNTDSLNVTDQAIHGYHAGGPLRVLHILNRLDKGGTELAVLKLMAGLSDGPFEHRLASLRGMDPRFERVPLPGGSLLTVGNTKNGFQFPLFRLASLMREYRPHIVHSRNWGAIEAIPAARLARVPVAIHSEHGYELDMLVGLPQRRRIFRRAVYEMADTVFAVSNELRDYHARQAWVPSHRIQVIYNGVDTQRFSPCPGLRASLRKKFGLPENRFLVGTVGRMVPIKDHSTLLRAVEKLISGGVDAHALLVGSGPESKNNELLVKSSPKLNGRVTFAGDSNDVPEFLNTMDAFAVTSISEGMSNTLLEAMAVGLPVVATAVGGNTEVIDAVHSSWLFTPRDSETLASRLALLASSQDLRKQHGAASRQRVVEHFSLNRMLDSYRTLYLELATRRKIRVREN